MKDVLNLQTAIEKIGKGQGKIVSYWYYMGENKNGKEHYKTWHFTGPPSKRGNI